MSARRVRRAVVAALLALALPSVAGAQTLYRWTTKDGRVEVGPFPPAGVHAEPWKPEDEEKPKPPAAPNSAMPVNPSSPPSVAPAPIQSPRNLNGLQMRNIEEERQRQVQQDCDAKRSATGNLLNQKQVTEREIKRLEKEISELEDSLVAAEESSCLSDSAGHTSRNCREGGFDRDASLERDRKDLDKAQSKLDDLERKEQEARSSDDPCTKPKAAPAKNDSDE
jgi:hypothetical protein